MLSACFELSFVMHKIIKQYLQQQKNVGIWIHANAVGINSKLVGCLQFTNQINHRSINKICFLSTTEIC